MLTLPLPLPLLLFLTACTSTTRSGGSTASMPSPHLGADTEADRAWARGLNAPEGPQPPTTFRSGHVSPRTLPAEAVTRAEGRFEVRFPSGAPITTPAVYGGRIFTSGGFKGKEFYALDARSGASIWGVDLDDDGPSAPACAEGVCVFNTESCTIFALSAETGAPLWSWWMGDPMLSAPAIANGLVYTSYPVGHLGNLGNLGNLGQYSTNNANIAPSARQEPAEGPPAGATHVLAALDLRTGQIRWQRWLDGDVISSPVVSEGNVYVTTFSGTMLTLTAAEGEITGARRGQATSAPTVVGESIYWSQRSDGAGGGGGGGGGAREALAGAGWSDLSATRFAGGNERAAPYLDASVQRQTGYAQSGQQLDAANGFGGGAPASSGASVASGIVGQETVSRLQAYQGSKVIHAFGLNYTSMGDEVVATDPGTGEVRWRHALPGDLAAAGGMLAAPPAVAGRWLVIATLSGEVRLLDPQTGAVKRTLSVGAPLRAQPVISEGWIYLGAEDGRLIGLDTGDPSLTGWPMWGGDAARQSRGTL